MKKIITLLCAVATLTACDIDRLPYGSMSAEQITQDPTSSLESLVNGCYAQLKSWSDPMHRLGEYAGDNMAKDKSSTDAFLILFLIPVMLIIIVYKAFGTLDIKLLHKLRILLK